MTPLSAEERQELEKIKQFVDGGSMPDGMWGYHAWLKLLLKWGAEAEGERDRRIPKACPICTVEEMICPTCHNPRATQAEAALARAEQRIKELGG